jgi:hypothetical protein
MEFENLQINDAPFKLISSFATKVGETIKIIRDLQEQVKNDPNLKERLRTNTESVLAEKGIDGFFMQSLVSEIRGDIQPSDCDFSITCLVNSRSG